MALLKVIFSVNKKIVGSKNPTKKTLVIVLRDFNEKRNNLQNIIQKFSKAIKEDWAEIMPDGPQISDYFNIEYVPLPHCDLEEKFIEKVS